MVGAGREAKRRRKTLGTYLGLPHHSLLSPTYPFLFSWGPVSQATSGFCVSTRPQHNGRPVLKLAQCVLCPETVKRTLSAASMGPSHTPGVCSACLWDAVQSGDRRGLCFVGRCRSGGKASQGRDRCGERHPGLRSWPGVHAGRLCVLPLVLVVSHRMCSVGDVCGCGCERQCWPEAQGASQ